MASPDCSVPCNLCAGRDVALLSLAGRGGTALQTVICKNCGLAWTDPRPDAVRIKDFYDKDYRLEYKGTYRPKPKHVYRAGSAAVDRLSVLRNIVGKGAPVLDVGAGGGEFVYVLRRCGYDAIGIEPNTGYASFAAHELNIPVEIGFIQNTEFAARSFGVVTMHHVFEHLDDPSGTLERLHQYLADDGYLIIDVPNVEAKCVSPDNRFHDAHLYSFNPLTLATIVENTSFEMVSLELSSDKGVISAIFKKGERHRRKRLCKIYGNFNRVYRAVTEHTKVRHYLSAYPYLRPLGRLRQRIPEFAATRNYPSARAILDELLRRSISLDSGMK